MTWHRAVLRLFSLESRDVPATFGTPWLDGMHVTLSFAPDGTVISGAASDLQAVLHRLGPASRREILRAFQSWTANANLNVGIVSDGGQDFSAGGAFQGDSRFGDIRLGARSFASDVLAVTSPFNFFDSFSGNIVLNSDLPVSIGGAAGNDLFTIFLQEAGHAFGVGNSPNTDSAMYEYYLGPRTGLAADDVAAIQSLYGVRRADAFEGAGGNNTSSRAAAYRHPLEADITTAGDVDHFRFSTELLTYSVTVKLQAAGLSLLTARVELLDSTGRVIAGASADDPTRNDVTIHVHGVMPSAAYTVRVRAADGSPFNVGSYGLTIEQRSVRGDLLGATNDLLHELGLNDTLASATQLAAQTAGLGSPVDYNTRARLSAENDVDYYRIRAPQSADGAPVTLIAAVWGLDNAALDPRVQVLDAAGNALDAQVLTNDGRTFVVQVRHAAPGADHFLRVHSATGQIGSYDLAADFRSSEVAFDLNATGRLTADISQSTALLSVAQTGFFHFVLSGGRTANGNGAVEMSIVNSAGVAVFQLASKSGDARSAKVVLAAGNYQVRVRLVGGAALDALAFDLRGSVITDPIGALPVDTTSAPEGSAPPSSGSGKPPTSSPPIARWEGQTPSDGSSWF